MSTFQSHCIFWAVTTVVCGLDLCAGTWPFLKSSHWGHGEQKVCGDWSQTHFSSRPDPATFWLCILGKWCNLPASRFSVELDNTLSHWAVESKWNWHVKCLSQCPVHSRLSVRGSYDYYEVLKNQTNAIVSVSKPVGVINITVQIKWHSPLDSQI